MRSLGASAQGRGRSQQQLRPQRAQVILAVPLSHTFTICLTPPPCPALRSRPPPELQAKIRVSSRPCLCPRLSKVSAPEKLAPAPQLLFQVFPTLAQPTIWLMSLCQPELLSSPPRICPPSPEIPSTHHDLRDHFSFKAQCQGHCLLDAFPLAPSSPVFLCSFDPCDPIYPGFFALRCLGLCLPPSLD